MRMMKKSGVILCLAWCLCSVCACAPAWKYQENAILIHYKSDSQLNRYQGNAHTLMLCVYQLRDPNMFHQLLGEDEGISKLLECSRFDPSVTGSKRLVVYPGREKTEFLDRAEGTKYVGIVAGYYSLDKEGTVRFMNIPLSLFNNPKLLPVDLYLGSEEIQKGRER